MHRGSFKIHIRRMGSGFSYQVLLTAAPGHYVPARTEYDFPDEKSAKQAAEIAIDDILSETA